MGKTHMLKREWADRTVTLLREMNTIGGDIFPVGTKMKVIKNNGGLYLRTLTVCPCCGHGRHHYIKNVSERDVRLEPLEPLPEVQHV